MDEDTLREAMRARAVAEKQDQPKSYFRESHKPSKLPITSQRRSLLESHFEEHPEPIALAPLSKITKIPHESLQRLCQRMALDGVLKKSRSSGVGRPIFYQSSAFEPVVGLISSKTD